MPGVSSKDLDVSRETFDRLTRYADLIRKWNPAINLVAPSTLPNLWDRHLRDSIQVFRAADPGFRSWADLGSGGGLPGIVVAILAKEDNPLAHVSLVESDQRKATFLRTVVRELGLNAEIHAARVEIVAELSADVLSARALASLDRLLPMAERHLGSGGYALFPKGARWKDEIDAALQNWRFRYCEIASITNPDSVILRIEDIARAQPV